MARGWGRDEADVNPPPPPPPTKALVLDNTKLADCLLVVTFSKKALGGQNARGRWGGGPSASSAAPGSYAAAPYGMPGFGGCVGWE